MNEEEFRMKGGTKAVKISTSMKKYFYDPSEVEAEDSSVAQIFYQVGEDNFYYTRESFCPVEFSPVLQ